MAGGAAGRVTSIQCSDGGVPKHPVPEALVTLSGLQGDRQRDLVHHGGPDRAVVLYCLQVIEALRREGHPIAPGSVGENLTVSGLDWGRVVPGVELRIGPVRLQVTRFTTPCPNLRGSLWGGDFSRVAERRHPGWSRVCARVLAEGVVRVGDTVELAGEARA